MKKVTIEITDTGWKTTIVLGDKTIIDKNELTAYGAQGLNESLEFNDDVPDELYEALVRLECYDVGRSLEEIEI